MEKKKPSHALPHSSSLIRLSTSMSRPKLINSALCSEAALKICVKEEDGSSAEKSRKSTRFMRNATKINL